MATMPISTALAALSTPPVFVPTAWLQTFESLGGGYAIGGSFLRLGIVVGNQTDAELAQARMMVRSLTLDDRAAIYAHICASRTYAGRI